MVKSITNLTMPIIPTGAKGISTRIDEKVKRFVRKTEKLKKLLDEISII
ncbi:MAG: hypothetical protein HY753_05140 [Nitrospirae bacterium]|nr:hypothetical protein [Nitrospirota bacterium]